MGVLRTLLRTIPARGIGNIPCTEHLADERTCILDGFFRDAGRIGAHVGDEPGKLAITYIHPFVELLRQRHGAFRGEAQSVGSGLLKRAGRKWRRRVAGNGFLPNCRNSKPFPSKGLADTSSGRLIPNLGLLTINLDEVG